MNLEGRFRHKGHVIVNSLIKRKLLPESLLPIIRNFYESIIGLIYDITLIKQKDAITPPFRLRTLVIGQSSIPEYRKGSEDYLSYLKRYCHLTPQSSILDVGCGCGRITWSLTKYLSHKGIYEGFDIIKKVIDWSTGHITTKFPNFHFFHADIYNKFYNPLGKELSASFQFPYESNTYNVVLLLSVFTHMKPKEVGHYLKEINRVLKPNGYCLITYFLLNNKSLDLLANHSSVKEFLYKRSHYRTGSEEFEEEQIAYEESYIKQLYQKFGLVIKNIHYGSWCGRKRYLDFQDIVIAKKLTSKVPTSSSNKSKK